MLECERKVQSLVDLCIQNWVCNVWLLGDVGGIDEYLLDRMLPLCTVDQLKHVEESAKGRDLSSLTDKLWKKFYEKRFGNTNEVVERMGKNLVSFKWKLLYEENMKEMQALERMRLLCLYDYEDAYRGQSHLKTEEEMDSLSSEEEEEEFHLEEEVEEVEGEEESIEEEEEKEEESKSVEEEEDEDGDEDEDEEENEDDHDYEDDGYGDGYSYDDDHGYDYDYDYDYGYDYDHDYDCDCDCDYDEF